MDKKAIAVAMSYTDEKFGQIPSPYKTKPAVATVADLPASGNTAGDVRRVTATGVDYYWDGNSWETFVAGEKFTNADRTKLDGISAGATAVSVSNEGTATDPIQYIIVNGVEKRIVGAGSDENAVHFTADAGKTDAEKLQARTNIGAYSKPSGGIPASDLASAVVNAINGSEQKSRMVTAISGDSDNDHYPSAKAVRDAFGSLFLVYPFANNSEWGTVSGGGTFFNGRQVTVTATAGSGYEFINWKNAHTLEILSTDASYTFEVTGNIALKATFKDSSYVVPSWSSGTDAEIAQAVEFHGDGLIDLADYWSIGDTRTVTLSAMASDSAKGYEAHASQDVELVLMDSTCTGITVNGQKPAFIVGQKNGLLETGQMNSSGTNAGGWGACKRRGWCNDVYKMAIPSTLRSIFKQFTWQYVKSGTDGTLLTANDYFALPPERAIFASRSYSRTEEWALFNQWAWYQTAANRIKKTGTSGSASSWWECSPMSGYGSDFCRVANNGGACYWGAYYSFLLAPFGCI